MKFFLALLMLGMSLVCAAGQVEFDRSQAQSQLIQFLQETGIPSVSLTVFDADGELWSVARGYQDVHKRIPATPDTYYDIGSNAKIITAAAVLTLAEAGKLDLNTPAQQYLAEPVPALTAHAGKPVLLQHLLNHLAGIPTAVHLSPIWRPELYLTPAQQLATIESTAIPGSTYQYCNLCFMLAALIVEQSAGVPFADYVDQHILLPAGVDQLGFLRPLPAMYSKMALPYHLRHGVAYPMAYHISANTGAGGAWMSSEQLARVLRALFSKNHTPSVLSPDSRAAMLHDYTDIAGYNAGYGLGVGLERDNGRHFPFHQGSMPGFISEYIYDPASGKGLVLCANVTANNEAEQQLIWLRNELFHRYNPAFRLSNPRPPVHLRKPLSMQQQAMLPNVVGDYRSPSPAIHMSVIKRGEEYYLINPAGQRFHVARLSQREFILTNEAERFEIDFDDENKAVLMMFYSSDSAPPLALPRVADASALSNIILITHEPQPL